jgi:hypothetical protein
MRPPAIAIVILAGAAASAVAQPVEHAGGPQPAARAAMERITPVNVRATVDRLAAFGTRHSLSETNDPQRGIGAARAWIKRELEEYARVGGGRMVVSLEEFEAPKGPRVPAPVMMANVVAVIPGTMPEAAGRRYYIIGHYDSMPGDVMDAKADAPGANDDGSGTTVVMEVARALAGHPCEATVVLVCTVGEEQGLIGAKYHADRAAAEGADIRAVLSNDIVGDPWGPGGDQSRATPGLVRVFSEGLPRNAGAQELARIRGLGAEGDSPSRQLARYVAEVARAENTTVKPMLVFRLDRFLRGGDHSAFNDAGFAAVRFTEVDEDYRRQHQYVREEAGPDGAMVRIGDLPEAVDETYLANVARLNVATVVHLANAPSPVRNARIVTAMLENQTTVRWAPSPEPDVAGYEVVWRATTAAEWEHSRDVGKAMEAVLDVSKDNFFFGVRAYDREGYRSPVSFCGAGRE